MKDATNKKVSACGLCGKLFSHYVTQPKLYCDDCNTRYQVRDCPTCGDKLYRHGKETLSNFLKRETCDNCHGANNATGSDTLAAVFQELIMDKLPSQRLHHVPEEYLQDAINENCAYFRLYILYSFLTPYNDGCLMCDRLPNTQLYLNDILRRIKNINDILDRKPKTRSTYLGWYIKNKDKSAPTTADLVEIEKERRHK